MLASNLVLAGYRGGFITLEQALERQRQIVESPDASPDGFCERLNLASYLLLAGRTAAATEEIESLGEYLLSRSIHETI